MGHPERGARKWIADRPDWVAYRTKYGATVEVVPVLMSRSQKTVPFERA